MGNGSGQAMRPSCCPDITMETSKKTLPCQYDLKAKERCLSFLNSPRPLFRVPIAPERPLFLFRIPDSISGNLISDS